MPEFALPTILLMFRSAGESFIFSLPAHRTTCSLNVGVIYWWTQAVPIQDDCVSSPKVLNNNPPCESSCTSQNLLPEVIILLNIRCNRQTHSHIIASEIFWEVPAFVIETQIGTDWVQTQMNILHPFMSERNVRYAGFPAMHWRSGSTFTMRGFSIVSARTNVCVWRILSIQGLTRVVSNRKTTNWQRNHWCEQCADWACKLIKECGC